MDAVALCIWREARGAKQVGMYAVACVIANRVKSSRYPNTPDAVVMQPWAFTSMMNSPKNGELHVYPPSNDAEYEYCIQLSSDIRNGKIVDTTQGATLYHDISIKTPITWVPPKVTFIKQIGRLKLFFEH